MQYRKGGSDDMRWEILYACPPVLLWELAVAL
jgi:hypothetical protein